MYGMAASDIQCYFDDEAWIAFGNDIDSYMSTHFCEVCVPRAKELHTT